MDDRFTAKDRVFVEGRSGRSDFLERDPKLVGCDRYWMLQWTSQWRIMEY